MNPYSKGPAFVYRIYEPEGCCLLYVGSSLHVGKRLERHRRAEWWPTLEPSVEVQQFPTVAAATTAERHAIQTEHPRFNIHGRSSFHADWHAIDFVHHLMAVKVGTDSWWNTAKGFIRYHPHIAARVIPALLDSAGEVT